MTICSPILKKVLSWDIAMQLGKHVSKMMKNSNIADIPLLRKEPVLNLRIKGKGAFSTENRRLTWDLVVWPMLLI